MIVGFICQVNVKCNKYCLFEALHYTPQYTVWASCKILYNVEAATALLSVKCNAS